jgi:hypothetical protein
MMALTSLNAAEAEVTNENMQAVSSLHIEYPF